LHLEKIPYMPHNTVLHKENFMTKAELVKALKEKAGLTTLAQAEAACEGLFGIIKSALEKGDGLAISGFGSFKVVQKKARKGRNPRTGAEIQIPASKAVKFVPGKALKESM
jgi:DNA-binding protein HU-beta